MGCLGRAVEFIGYLVIAITLLGMWIHLILESPPFQFVPELGTACRIALTFLGVAIGGVLAWFGRSTGRGQKRD